MKAATGATVYASEADAVILESGGKKGFHPVGDYKPVKVDRILKDGDVVRLGEVAMTAHLTPGHTEGNTAWTMQVEEDGKEYNVVFTSSMSINPGVKMVGNPTWAGVAEAYARSFAKLKALPCDVFLGPHAPFFNMEEKVKRLGAKPNPFIDPQGLRNFLEMNEKNYREQIERERTSLQSKPVKQSQQSNYRHTEPPIERRVADLPGRTTIENHRNSSNLIGGNTK
jgi:metallo-beta-lactamase class B